MKQLKCLPNTLIWVVLIIDTGQDRYRGHAFLVAAEEAGRATCGAIIKFRDEHYRYEGAKKVTAVGGDQAQVDCTLPGAEYTTINREDYAAFEALPVQPLPTE
jgi:hypothetical protein